MTARSWSSELRGRAEVPSPLRTLAALPHPHFLHNSPSGHLALPCDVTGPRGTCVPTEACRLSSMSPGLLLQHSTNQKFGGEKGPRTKGQDWLSLDRGSRRHILLQERQVLLQERVVGAWGVALALTTEEESSEYTCSRRPLEALRRPLDSVGRGATRGSLQCRACVGARKDSPIRGDGES